GRVHDKIGERLVTNAELIFENCRVPKENMMWEWNEAFRNVPKLARQSNAYAAASALGVARAAFEKALEWAKTRVQGGKLIIEHPNIAIELGDMWLQIEAARLLIWKAAWAADHPEHFDPKLARSPKILASEVAMRTALKAMEIHGGYGSMKEVGIEKLVRDASVFLHSDGTNDVLKLVVGNLLKSE
ncbi:MAG: acyl-CoA dehydrogenase family protein, partial [bacterium]